MTGESTWELPDGIVLSYPTEDITQLEVANEKSIGSEDLDGAVSITGSIDLGGGSIKLAQSFTVKSAKSVGLAPSPKMAGMSSQQLHTLAGSFYGSMHSLYSMSSKAAPIVNNDLKPKKTLSKKHSGFQLLKKSAKELRRERDSSGDVWVEYQPADVGMPFYAKEDSLSGQWLKPDVFKTLSSKSKKSPGVL